MVLFWESWTDSLQEQGSTWSSLGQIFLHNNVAHVRHQTCSKSCWTAAHKSWTAAHLQWRSQPASMGSTQEHIQEGLPKNCSSTKSLSDSLQQKLLGSSLQSWRAAPLPLVSPCVSPLSKLAKVGQQQLPSCWTAALYAAPINSKAGNTTLLSMQQLPRGQTSWAALNQNLHTCYSPKLDSSNSQAAGQQQLQRPRSGIKRTEETMNEGSSRKKM